MYHDKCIMFLFLKSMYLRVGGVEAETGSEGTRSSSRKTQTYNYYLATYDQLMVSVS